MPREVLQVHRAVRDSDQGLVIGLEHDGRRGGWPEQDVDPATISAKRVGFTIHAQLQLQREIGIDDAATRHLQGDRDRSAVSRRTNLVVGWQPRAEGRKLVEQVRRRKAQRSQLVHRDVMRAHRSSNQLGGHQLLQTVRQQVRRDPRPRAG